MALNALVELFVPQLERAYDWKG